MGIVPDFNVADEDNNVRVTKKDLDSSKSALREPGLDTSLDQLAAKDKYRYKDTKWNHIKDIIEE